MIQVPVTFEGRTIAMADVDGERITFAVKDRALLDEFALFGLSIADVVPAVELPASMRIHTLVGNGTPHEFNGDPVDGPVGHAKCACGELSEKVLLSYYQRQKWFKGHAVTAGSKTA